jgi:hypothetical protein
MKRDSMQHIPLSIAYLCQDCSCVGNSPHQCPACASAVLMGLSNILDRKQEKKSRTRIRATEFPAWRPQIQIAA